MFTNESLSDLLRSIAVSLESPVILILLIIIAATIIMLGTLIAELITERLHMKAKLPALLNALEKKERGINDIIRDSGLLKRQIATLMTIAAQTELTALKREALAAELIFEEKNHYDLRVKFTDLIMRLGPVFGLLGTLIPLGPGIIALGRGDTHTLSASLLVAFDTTIAGLISAAVATVISTIRKRWYLKYMMQLETVTESLLEAMSANEEI